MTGHRIKVEARPGEHWICECGKWEYHNDAPIEDNDILIALVHAHFAHVKEEENAP